MDIFLDWARGHCIPLSGPLSEIDGPLLAIIGDARLVSLGEGLHGAREPLDFRNALFVWLVERLQFRAMGLESGRSAGLAVDAYVQGGPGQAVEVVAEGITSGLHAFPQQAELVRWMREFNASAPAARRLSFHGIDTSALAGQPGAALDVALTYLNRCDPSAARRFREKLQPAWPLLAVDRMAPEPGAYTTLSEAQRDAVTATVADLIALVEIHEAGYTACTSTADHQRGLDAALAARQADLYLRQFPPGWSAAQGVAAIWPSVALSDRVKADNVERALQRLGSGGRMMLFAHLGHASTLPVSIQLGNESIALPAMMGSWLERRFGSELLTIGHLIGDNRCESAVGKATPESLEGRLATLGHAAFLLDLRRAPAPVLAELQRSAHPLHGQMPVHVLSPGLGIDVIFFTAQARPARSEESP